MTTVRLFPNLLNFFFPFLFCDSVGIVMGKNIYLNDYRKIRGSLP